MTNPVLRAPLRLATDSDFRAFHNREPPEVWLGVTAEIDGELVGFGTVAWDEWSRPWGYFDQRGASRFLMHRAALAVIAVLREIGDKPLHVFCSGKTVGDAKWLRRMGFSPDPVASGPHIEVWTNA